MLDSRGHVILIDFGLSKQAISHPRGAMSLVGTPDYSAPEVLKTGVHQIEQYNKQKAANNGKNNKGKNVAAVQTQKPLNIGNYQ
jgi:serine/threonine protein kinase